MFEPMIEAVGVVKRFGKTVARDELDLTAGDGSVLALLGPNFLAPVVAEFFSD